MIIMVHEKKNLPKFWFQAPQAFSLVSGKVTYLLQHGAKCGRVGMWKFHCKPAQHLSSGALAIHLALRSYEVPNLPQKFSMPTVMDTEGPAHPCLPSIRGGMGVALPHLGQQEPRGRIQGPRGGKAG